jgi:hypothetical protein
MYNQATERSRISETDQDSYQMRPIDFAKAAGVTTVVLVLNVIGSILVVLAYSFFIEPGQSKEFYDAAALRIAPWCSYTIGTALFFGAGYFCARRRPQRNGYLLPQ